MGVSPGHRGPGQELELGRLKDAEWDSHWPAGGVQARAQRGSVEVTQG